MNIFVLDYLPEDAARLQVNQSLNTMCKETAQMLSTNVRFITNDFGLRTDLTLYESTHVNHPCTEWARSSRQNFDWLVRHGLELCAEWNRRFPNSLSHASLRVIKLAASYTNRFPDLGPTIQPQAMDSKYQHADVVTAYRRFYQSKWYVPATWIEQFSS